jgi:hypothetical protein
MGWVKNERGLLVPGEERSNWCAATWQNWRSWWVNREDEEGCGPVLGAVFAALAMQGAPM